MNRRITLSIVSIMAMAGMVAGATFAFFSSNATSNNNTFATGSLTLQVDDANEPTPAASVSGSITASNFAPGQSVSSYISLHNPGSLSIVEVEMTMDTSETADPGNDSSLSDVLILNAIRVDDATPDTACVGGANLASTIDAAVGNSDGTLRLSEFDNLNDVYDALPGLGVGETRNVCFDVLFESTAGNEYQGDAVSTTITFTGNQDVSQ